MLKPMLKSINGVYMLVHDIFLLQNLRQELIPSCTLVRVSQLPVCLSSELQTEIFSKTLIHIEYTTSGEGKKLTEKDAIR